jgi:hypothetical protein
MDALALQFFPFPYVLDAKRRDGLAVSWPERCLACTTRDCEKASPGGLSQCRYGVNYQRLTDDFLVAGVVIRDYRPETDAARKMRKRVGKDAVTRAEFDRVVERARQSTEALAEKLRESQEALITEYRETKAYQQEVLELLRPDMLRALANVHDYKQFVQQIRQNLEVLMQSKPGSEGVNNVVELVDRASHEERAIYWAAVLMDERLASIRH